MRDLYKVLDIITEDGVFLDSDASDFDLKTIENSVTLSGLLYEIGFPRQIFFSSFKLNGWWVYYGWDSKLTAAAAKALAERRWLATSKN